MKQPLECFGFGFSFGLLAQAEPFHPLVDNNGRWWWMVALTEFFRVLFVVKLLTKILTRWVGLNYVRENQQLLCVEEGERSTEKQ